MSSGHSSGSGVVEWSTVRRYDDVDYSRTDDGIAKITICRPEVHNAFRPQTLMEISDALTAAREDPSIGVIILTGEGEKAFCSGGDQRVRGDTGYLTEPDDPRAVGRFHVTDLQVQIRRLPKPVVAMVAGYAIGGGHVLQIVCDLTIAADNARLGQVGPRVGSFDGGFGAGLLADIVGQRKAKEIWFLPMALRLMKASFHAAEDGLAGIQQLAHDTNLLFYSTDEAKEGREAFKAKRQPDFGKFPRRS